MIIPTYNRADIIERTINSVLNQTYINWELIIIDDGSTDNTKQVVRRFINNKKIKYYKINNSGVCYARNFGLDKAKGEYISLLDSDDEYTPDRIGKQLEYMMNDNVFFSLSNKHVVFEEDEFKNLKVECTNNYIVDTLWLIKNNNRSATLMMFNREILKECKFDEDLPSYNDIDFLLRVRKYYEILYIPEKLNAIHKSSTRDRISNNPDMKIKGCEIVYKKNTSNYYNLNFEENRLLFKEILKHLTLFNFLKGNNKEGKCRLDEYIYYENSKIEQHKLKLVYIFSLNGTLFKTFLLASRLLWKYGLIKV
ncbi:glycosyltransferase family 2 protein [Methanococcoides seepicolus]|uniref:Glycosyltransferase family 2 protein n=1 Tax=Methanococcoides seepicolus TaxID=2828780 RepID=A0A9E4ZG07_9EURY|nr:glycosyltransferase family 2 protein [Methanococcoides seepicolus]